MRSGQRCDRDGLVRALDPLPVGGQLVAMNRRPFSHHPHGSIGQRASQDLERRDRDHRLLASVERVEMGPRVVGEYIRITMPYKRLIVGTANRIVLAPDGRARASPRLGGEGSGALASSPHRGAPDGVQSGEQVERNRA